MWSEKAACWSTKATISLKRVKLEAKLPWRAIGSHQRSFEWYYLRPLRPPLSLDLGSQLPTKTPIAIISQVAKATHFKFSMHIQKLSGHSYKAHHAVIFAIAQLSCTTFLCFGPLFSSQNRPAFTVNPFLVVVLLPITLVVQLEQSVRGSGVCVCVCVCVWTITFELNDLLV